MVRFAILSYVMIRQMKFTLLCWMVLSIYYNFHTTVWKMQELL